MKLDSGSGKPIIINGRQIYTAFVFVIILVILIMSLMDFIDKYNPLIKRIANYDKNGIPERAFIRDIETLPKEMQYFIKPYQWAGSQLSGKICLDAGCGMGSATHFLAKYAGHITGIDSSEIAIKYAKQHYLQSNTDFKVMRVTDIQFPSDYFDIVTSFELLEHISALDQTNFCKGVSRVLKPEGLFLISTPNKNLTEGNNSYHICELTPEKLHALLSTFFSDVQIFGVNTNQEVLSDVNQCPILIGRCKKNLSS